MDNKQFLSLLHVMDRAMQARDARMREETLEADDVLLRAYYALIQARLSLLHMDVVKAIRKIGRDAARQLVEGDHDEY